MQFPLIFPSFLPSFALGQISNKPWQEQHFLRVLVSQIVNKMQDY